ncbi:RNA-3'-phosphate cyclase [Aureococcus anophagefferens]|nr:RNA-3'-phosphate cyclase [Aureococcus anophagefferens]
MADPKKHKESLNSDVIKLRGAKDLRSRLVLATLARKKLEIGGIRADDESPGLRKEEASFVRLMDKLTSGSRIEINETGTTLRYAPGFLAGGSTLDDRVLCADLDAHWYRTEAGDRPTPEDLGEAAAFVLLGEVNRGGVCDDTASPSSSRSWPSARRT